LSTRARREREKEERRQSILRAAREVFFEDGFHRATVDKVAQRAEVSKGTVYLYFESKETILAHLILEGLHQLVGELERAYAADEPLSAEERLRRLGQAYFRFFQREPVYYRFMMAMDRGRFQETVSPEIYRQVQQASMEGLNWVVRAVEQGMADGEFDCQDARRAAAALWATVNGALGLVEHPLRRELVGMGREALYQAVTETVIRGLRAAKRKT
jgi:AcrR family transcriptional regulator